MKSGMLSNADGVLENKRRRQKWKRLAGVLGCLMVIGITYILMRPAETLERELARQTERAGAAYETLTDEQKAQLNTDRLTALYIYLPAKEETFTLSAPATESGIVVTIFGKTTSIPCPVEELTLTATEVEDENANALRDQALEDEELTAAQNYILRIRGPL